MRFRGTPEELASAGAVGAPGDSPIERGYMSVLAGSTQTVDA